MSSAERRSVMSSVAASLPRTAVAQANTWTPASLPTGDHRHRDSATAHACQVIRLSFGQRDGSEVTDFRSHLLFICPFGR